MIETDGIFSTIITFLGGGAAIGFLTWLINNRKDRREGLKQIIDLYKEDNVRLRQEFEELKSLFEMHRERNIVNEKQNEQMIQQLRIQVNIMESTHLDLPIPQWLKDTQGIMLSINTAYEDAFGVKSMDYVGKTDYEIWDKEIADGFTANDKAVMLTKKHIQQQELIRNEFHEGRWEVVKFPRYEGRTLIGIGGIAFKQLDMAPILDSY